MVTFELLIIFSVPIHPCADRKVITKVSKYGCDNENKCFWFVKNGCTSFIPMDKVAFFGRRFDYDES